ncbi:hypothetical protein OROMI_012864 [Orobanche minor]
MASTSGSKSHFYQISNSETNCSGSAFSLPTDQNVHAEKRNAQKRQAYTSMDIQEKVCLLDNKRAKYRHQVGNNVEMLPSTSYQRTFPRSKKPRHICLPELRVRTKLANISSHAWSLPFSSPCPHCKAVLYFREPKRFCCLHGQISLALPRMPQRLWELYTSLESSAAVHFRRRCRTYNNTTAFSSLGIRYDETLVKSNKGIYTLRIQGAVYHFIRDLMPADGHGRQLQLYFYEPEHELENRLSQSGDLDVHILEDIIDLMQLNPYAVFFRGLRELVNLDEYNIVLRADPSLDMRIFNLPTVNQVAAIWNELTDAPAMQPHDIRVYAYSGKTHCVHYYYGCYDPLQYPLLFSHGESGWHTGIHRVSLVSAATNARSRRQCKGQEIVFPRSHLSGESILATELENMTNNKWKHNNVSAREFYCFLFQSRAGDITNILRTGRLAQQYKIDCYVKIETQRLDYLRSEQTCANIRTESLEGIIDSMACDGKLKGFDIGQRFVLPASYVGSPRDMCRRYLNALALVSEFGKPDFFITMTCNPNWPEIRAGLLPGEEAQNRSDLVARVFRGRHEEFKNEILKKKILG